ncbi:MAG: class C sortase [Clostridia bacterium]|nr:class C sortase [Clostridia bacterium]
MEQTKKPKKKSFTGILLVVIFFIGLLVMLYPSIADYVNSRVQSRAVADYEAMLNALTEDDYTEMFAAADAYNEKIKKVDYPFMYYDRVEGYDQLLNVDGRGMIGYIDIDKIKVELPIYHGTSLDVLKKAAGHVEGSSLPGGGPSTHCVISAHRGLPSAKLFTYLDKLEEGDIFTLTILNRVLTYQVDQILIVEPDEVDELYVVEGRDYCTLVTCTPYGINTQRLLVRGERIETARPKPVIYVKNEGYIIDPIIIAPAVAVPMLLILLVFLMVKYSKKTRKSPEETAKEILGKNNDSE